MALPSVQERLTGGQELILPPEGEDFLRSWEAGETDGMTCWRAIGVERRDGSAIEGRGLFATKNIAKNTIVAIKPVHVVDSRTIKDHADTIKGAHQQIGPNEFLTGLTEEEVDKNLAGYNHSHNPNARIVTFPGVPLAFLVTREPIEVTEEPQEITTDYSVSWTSETQTMRICNCGAESCPGMVAPQWDWMDENLQAKYAGEFPWFVQQAIDELNAMTPEERYDRYGDFSVSKLAAFVKLADDELIVWHDKKEESLRHLPGILRPLGEKVYRVNTAEGRLLERAEEIRLGIVGQFCIAEPSITRAMGLDWASLVKAMALPHDERTEKLHLVIGDKLNMIVGRARKIAYETGI